MHTVQPDHHVLGFDEIDRTQVALVGGKAASLGELARMDGIRVPAGFCVTTDAYRRVMNEATSTAELLDRLAHVDVDDRMLVRSISAEIRAAIEAASIPDDVVESITGEIARLDPRAAYAVRSSATAEDLPTASFAGQHDTYLNIVGPPAVLVHVGRCWASLFSERAVAYRIRSGIDHRTVRMAVVVQQMVDPTAAGVLFTADPATSNRKVASVEATSGLGDALVSGRVSADLYTVRDGAVVAKKVADKRSAMRASPGRGTLPQVIEPAQQAQPALTDAQVVQVVELGRRIEAHLGGPQDIEWCLVDDEFHIVQSRPITTLFPIPAVDDGANHVYVSVGHQQMMTDAMKPLGLSLWQLTALRPMFTAGGRLFVDVTAGLASPSSRAGLVRALGTSDPLIGDALQTILDRGNVIPEVPDDGRGQPAFGDGSAQIDADPAIVTSLIERTQDSLAALERTIRAKSGAALFDFILADIQEMKRLLLDPRSMQVIMTAIGAASWLNENLDQWLGEKNAADTLTQSVPHNVTSEMGLALLDVADVIRPHPAVVEFLRDIADEDFLDGLPEVPGGREARDAIRAYLDVYGMRCVGEIDVTRPRWAERPSTLIPVILANIKNFAHGERVRRFERGRQAAWNKEQEVLERLRFLPDGDRKADETKQMIDRVRTFSGYREYPKYGMVSRYFVYKRAMLAEAERLVETQVIRDPDDIFSLTFQELHEVVRANHVDAELIGRRSAEFRSYQALTPPRVLTSEGEVVTGTYHRDDRPDGVLVGLAVSAGNVEGRARVIVDMAEAEFEAGDILVTAHTDPSWSPLFVSAGGLVTEVGGLMTHGAVIAREYGLPAVVGVENATRLIRDGQRIRVDGTHGYIELLPATPTAPASPPVSPPASPPTPATPPTAP